jgi:hypothetical protein
MSHPVEFPSLAWFRALAAELHANESAYRELGAIDCAMVIEVEHDNGVSELVEIVFEAFGVRSIRPLARLEDACPSHFVLTAPLAVWREMLDDIRAHGAAGLTHTLNYLTFPDDPMRVSGPDQLEIDKFYRYAETLQRFFDGAARMVPAEAAAAELGRAAERRVAP